MEKREIKFRAWNNGEMLSQPIEGCFGLSRFFGFLREDAVLMQFTGLKDKNGVEIYEGDLLRYPGDSEHFTAYEVFFHDGDANSDFNIGYYCGRTHHQGSICGGPIPSFKPKSVAQMEICGNIFQNPELLTR